MIYKDKSCRSSLVPLDKSEGSVKGIILLGGALAPPGLTERLRTKTPGFLLDHVLQVRITSMERHYL